MSRCKGELVLDNGPIMEIVIMSDVHLNTVTWISGTQDTRIAEHEVPAILSPPYFTINNVIYDQIEHQTTHDTVKIKI